MPKEEMIMLCGVNVIPSRVSALWTETGGYNGNGGYNRYIFAVIDGVKVTLMHTCDSNYITQGMVKCREALGVEGSPT
ncbi:hypothetical protein ES708_16544 [subsurface metagenome]